MSSPSTGLGTRLEPSLAGERAEFTRYRTITAVEVSIPVEPTRWQGAAALQLSCGPTTAVVVPNLGMTAVSFQHGELEYVDAAGGARQLNAGYTSAVPLLAPWANRLHDFTFDLSGQRTDVRTSRTRTDALGLPIHGWLVSSAGSRLVHQSSTPERSVVGARRDVSAPGHA